MADNIRADLIIKALSERHSQDVFLTEVKSGATWFSQTGELLRFDAVAMKRSWAKPCITIYEVKVSRNDFQRDDKWPAYRDYCHRLYFACPSGLIQPDELAPDVGLVWYKPKTGGLVWRKGATYRDIDIPWSMFYYLLLSRTESDRHPFFRGRAEFFRAWLEDKEKLRDLGYMVRNRMVEKLAGVEEKEREIEWLTSRVEKLDKELAAIGEVLQKHGINRSFWPEQTARDLDQALSGGATRRLINLAEGLVRDAERLRLALCPEAPAEAAEGQG
ncbi:MAG TPA: MmcB family DNA repair protein [Firmicutes bacterium]|nr:MmcB family DNA repair protein [Bacillota bacterium]